MTVVSETLKLEAAPAEVWKVLADFGGVASWNPGVTSARLLNAKNGGVGAERRCELSSGPKDFIHERITAWHEGSSMTVEIAGTNQPIKSGTMGFVLRPDGTGTQATFEMDYTLKFGPLGKIMDALMVRREMAKGARGILKGLKRHVDAPAGAVERRA